VRIQHGSHKIEKPPTYRDTQRVWRDGPFRPSGPGCTAVFNWWPLSLSLEPSRVRFFGVARTRHPPSHTPHGKPAIKRRSGRTPDEHFRRLKNNRYPRDRHTRPSGFRVCDDTPSRVKPTDTFSIFFSVFFVVFSPSRRLSVIHTHTHIYVYIVLRDRENRIIIILSCILFIPFFFFFSIK